MSVHGLSGQFRQVVRLALEIWSSGDERVLWRACNVKGRGRGREMSWTRGLMEAWKKYRYETACVWLAAAPVGPTRFDDASGCGMLQAC